MATVKSDLTTARRYLIEAYKALKDARTHCDGVVGVDGIHYQDITQIMRQVDEMAHICKIELDRLEQGILTSKES